MEEGKRIRVIKPADKKDKTKNIGRQTVIDQDIIDIFIALKKEHGRHISESILQDSFKKNPFDFQRFLANQLNGDINDGGIDGIIGPRTSKDVSRINYIYDMSDIRPELTESVAGALPLNVSTITRDTDKNNIYGQSKNVPPIELDNKTRRPKRKKKSPIKKFKT